MGGEGTHDEGVARVAFLVVLAVVVVVIVLVMRSAAAGGSAPRRPRPPRIARPKASRPLAPDDDEDFLRELARRARRDDGTTF